MPYLDRNMSPRIFYSSICAEILRIGRANNISSIFYSATKIIIQHIVKQDGKLNTTDKTLNKVFGQHFDLFKKFIYIYIYIYIYIIYNTYIKFLYI